MSHDTSVFLRSSPASWQRELARRTAYSDMLQRAAAWVMEDEATGAVLQSGPLFGQALIELTAWEMRQAGTNTRPARHARPKPAGSVVSISSELYSPGAQRRRVDGRGGMYEPEGSPSFNRPSPAVKTRHRSSVEEGHGDRSARTSFIPDNTRVERALLGQLASRARAVYSESRRPDIAPQGVSRYSAAGVRATDKRQSATGFQATTQRHHRLITLEAAAREAARSPGLWQQELITRTRRMLHPRYSPGQPLNHRQQGLIARTEQTLHPASSSAQPGEEEALLAQQWAALIDGPTAPLELLLASAQSAERGQAARGMGARDERGGVVTGVSTEQRAPLSEEHFHLPRTSGMADPSGNQLHHAGRHGMPQTFDEGDDGVRGPARQPMESEVGRQVLPPTLVSLLPPLTTPQGVSAPPLPVATATVRMGSRVEAMVDEDLDVLAARIKRILDDEARRHGIDV
jgi:hypothetical protein